MAHWSSFRAAIYSHDSFGLGHLTRSLRLARAISETVPDSCVLILTGSPLACRSRLPRGVECVKLPSVTKRGAEDYVARELALSFRRIRQMRVHILRDSVRLFRPHALFVDNVPLGLKREMLPVLEDVRRLLPDTRVILNLRDVLDDPGVVRGHWRDEGIYDALNQFYDAIQVFGDAAIHDAVTEYVLPRTKTSYLGYVAPYADEGSAPPSSAPMSHDGPKILLTIGGGEDGVENVLGALAFQRAIGQERGYRLEIVLGPFPSLEARRQVHASLAGLEGVRLHEYVEQLSGWMPHYDAVVSMGGYNTLCEVMARALRSIVIPRVHPRREQEIRARALEARGLLRVLDPANLSPRGLDLALSTSLEEGPFLPTASKPPLNGIPRFRAMLRELVANSATDLRTQRTGSAAVLPDTPVTAADRTVLSERRSGAGG